MSELDIQPAINPAPPLPPPKVPSPPKPIPAEEDDGMTVGEFLDGAAWEKFKQVKLSTHMLGGAVIALGIAWQDATFRAQAMEVFKSMPHWLQGGLTTAATMYAIYKRTHKKGQ